MCIDSRVVVLFCGLLQIDFTHIFQDKFASNNPMLRLRNKTVCIIYGKYCINGNIPEKLGKNQVQFWLQLKPIFLPGYNFCWNVRLPRWRHSKWPRRDLVKYRSISRTNLDRRMCIDAAGRQMASDMRVCICTCEMGLLCMNGWPRKLCESLVFSHADSLQASGSDYFMAIDIL